MTKKISLIFVILLLAFEALAQSILYYSSDLGIQNLLSKLDTIDKPNTSINLKPVKISQNNNITRPEYFPKPLSLENQVELWTKVYSVYDSNQVIFHDQEDPRVIYCVLDLPRV